MHTAHSAQSIEQDQSRIFQQSPKKPLIKSLTLFPEGFFYSPKGGSHNSEPAFLGELFDFEETWFSILISAYQKNCTQGSY
jgi:hypothetical protein